MNQDPIEAVLEDCQVYTILQVKIVSIWQIALTF